MNFKTASANIFIILLVLFTLPPLTGCSNNIAGAVSETTNGAVSTVLIGPNNEPLDEAEVTLTPTDYLFNDDTTSVIHRCSLNAGKIVFPNLPSGDYNMLIKSSNVSHFLKTTYDSIEDSFSNIDDSIQLKENVYFCGQLFETEIKTQWVSYFIAPLGFNTFSKIDSLGNFEFSDLPSGDLEFQILKKTNDTFSNETIYDSFDRSFNPGDTVTNYQIFPNSDHNMNVSIIRYIYDINNHWGKQVDIGAVSDPINLAHRKLKVLPSIVKHLLTPSLNLSNNELDQIPSELFEMPNLKTLNLSYNKITFIPSNVDKAQKLETLNVSSNELISLPYEITTVKSITSINVNNNKLNSISDTLKNWLNSVSTDPSWLSTQKQPSAN